MKGFLITVILAAWTMSNCFSQEVDVVGFTELEDLIHEKPGKTRVVNFWATWCKPCIKEMPYFESTANDYNEDIELIFVSLDFVENLENKVKPFLLKWEIESRVILLDDIDYNSWIDKVNPGWSGAIPATLIIEKESGNQLFFEQEFEKEELDNLIKKLINNS